MKYSKQFIEALKLIYSNEKMIKMAEDGEIILGRYIDDSTSRFPASYVLEIIEKEGVEALSTIREKVEREQAKEALYDEWLSYVRQLRKKGMIVTSYTPDFIEKVAKLYGKISNASRFAISGDYILGRVLDDSCSGWPVEEMLDILNFPDQQTALRKLKEVAEYEQAKNALYSMWSEEYQAYMVREKANSQKPSQPLDE